MRILITGAWNAAEEHFMRLSLQGHDFRFMQNEAGPLPCDPEWPEAVICNGLFLHYPLSDFPNLRYVQLTSAGTDRFPVGEAQARGIELHNARGVYSIPMAEYALAGVLQLYKRLTEFSAQKTERIWLKHRNLPELYGKTVLILGCGSVGTACAARFKAFGCRVLGADAVPREDSSFDSISPVSETDSILPETDILVVCLPLTADTTHFVDARRLSLLKSGSVLVNISRGAVVEQASLPEFLKDRLSGAVLDVFETEPLPEDSPLWACPNVILTPHNSFAGEGNARRLSETILNNLRDYGRKTEHT